MAERQRVYPEIIPVRASEHNIQPPKNGLTIPDMLHSHAGVQSGAFWKCTMRPVSGSAPPKDIQSLIAPVNIWSHLFGAAQFLLGLAQFLQLQSLASSDNIPSSDVAAVSLYYLCVVACFGVSTFFHTFSDHSPAIHKFGNELDHLGIVLVMWGTGMSGTHFAFYCNNSLRLLYFAAITATGSGCAVFTLQPKFRQPTYRTARFLLYCFLGGSLFAPVVHGIFKFGLAELAEMIDLKSFLGLAVINFSGAAIYAARIPERWFPGTFDLVGQSHNLMHVLVFLGAIVRLNGLHTVVDRWQKYNMQYGHCISAN